MAATAGLVASIVAAAATTATSIAGTVKGEQARDEQLKLQKKQLSAENRARDLARKRQSSIANAGATGTILAPTGLGGQGSASVGKASLLGG